LQSCISPPCFSRQKHSETERIAQPDLARGRREPPSLAVRLWTRHRLGTL